MARIFFQTPAGELTPDNGVIFSLTVTGEHRPSWLKIRPAFGPNYMRVKNILKTHGRHSVCQEAACPNIRECLENGTATFLIPGKVCTRRCRFCDVISGSPGPPDPDESAHLARAAAELRPKQVVITSVTRDDMPDGGASLFPRTINHLRQQDKEVKIEILIPDMRGKKESVETALSARPQVFAHNVETVGGLYKRVRPGAKLVRSSYKAFDQSKELLLHG